MPKIGMNLLLWTTHVTEQQDAILDQIKQMGFDAVEVPIFDTADLAPFERLGKRIKALGLGATAVTVMGAETNLYLLFEGKDSAVTAVVDARSLSRTGDTIKIAFDLYNVHLFDKETENTIIKG